MASTAQTDRGWDPRVPMRLPVMDREATQEELRELRRIFVGHTRGQPVPPDALPVLLAPLRDATQVRHDYPLFLATTADGLDQHSVGGLLRHLVEKSEARSRLLLDNMVRLERHLRAEIAVDPARTPMDAVRAAADTMLRELELRAAAAQELRADLDALIAAMPEIGRWLPLDAEVPRILIEAAAAEAVGRARAAFQPRVRSLAAALRQALGVEAAKRDGQGPKLESALGDAGARFLDPGAIARAVGPHRGTQRADSGRFARMQGASRVLEARLEADDASCFELFHSGEVDVLCAAAAECFDRAARQLVDTLRAVRVAELELAGTYDPARHDPLLAALDWRHCAADELRLLPVVAVALPAESLVQHGMQALLETIASRRPIQVVALRATDDPQRFAPLPLELGYLGIACREVHVQQASVSRPAHLLAGFRRACAGARAGLHFVDTGHDAGGAAPALGAFLHAGAAIEARAQPLFHYDPDAGETWARRLDFGVNPAPDSDWPTATFTAAGADGREEQREATFTFADYALLDATVRAHFALVPDALRSDDIVPLAQAIAQPLGAEWRALPYVLVATPDGRVQRALVDRDLTQVCRDRLRFWHTLQELAGVRNEYVREAVERARAEAADAAARERAELERAHAEALAAARRAAAEDALAGLARSLLALGPTALEGVVSTAAPASAGPAAPPPAAAAAPAPATPAAPAAAGGDEEPAWDEPWIESALCTSCNDCINLNSLLFVYNENKQARIGDPRAGTFAQLVVAAEKCPSRCIHPGRPLDATEPDLADLVRRAAPFNR